MKKTIFKCLLTCLALTTISCSDDDNASSPTITGVTTTTPGAEYIKEADPGQMIVIEGEGIGGASAVTVNDQSIYLNPCFNTDTHIIVTIPSSITLTAEDESLSDCIRVTTNYGEASYDFYVRPPEQWITGYAVERTMQPDGSSVATVGAAITIMGSNFYDVEGVYLCSEGLDESGNILGEKSALTNISVNETFSEITANLPQTVIAEGYFVVETRRNASQTVWASVASATPIIETISSDMPIVGTIVTISGKNFVKLSGIDICGEYMIDAADITVNSDATELSFTLPKVPTSSGNGQLKVVNAGGSASTSFYNYNNVVADGDNTSMYFSWGADPNDPTGTKDGCPSTKNGTCWGINGTVGESDNIWWWGLMIFGGAQWPQAIPDDTPLSDVEFRVECYVDGDNVKWGFRCFDSDSYYASGVTLTDMNTGTTPTKQWFTCAIPLSQFTTATTYKEWKAMTAQSDAFGIYSQGLSVGNRVCTYFDNIRLYVKQ